MADTKQYKPASATIGHVAEQLVIAQILLSAPEALCCYQPVNDEEGVDLLIRRRHGIASLLLQIKATADDLEHNKRFDLTAWDRDLPQTENMYLLQCIVRPIHSSCTTACG